MIRARNRRPDTNARLLPWPPSLRARAYPRDLLGRRLVRLARRRQLATAVRITPRTLAIGAVVALAVAVIARIAAGADPLGAALAASLGVAVLAVLAIAVTIPAPRDIALAYDARVGLQERLSTAVTLGSDVDDEMRSLQRTDALRAARALDAAAAFPLRAPRRDLVLLVATAALIAIWLWISGGGLLEPPIDIPAIVPGSMASEADPAGGSIGAAPAPPVSAETLAEIRALQASLEQLRAQIDPSGAAAGQALADASESLRRSAGARSVGRPLSSEDFAAAADALRRLVDELSQMNAAQLEELAESFSAAAGAAAADPVLSERFDQAAAALERSRLADAQAALAELAERVESAGASIANNQAIEREIEALEQALASALKSSQGASSRDPATEGDGAAVGEDAGAAGATQDGGSTAGSGASNAAGQVVPDALENLPPGQRIGADGNLEIVRIDASADTNETVDRPILELGTDREQRFDAPAGSLGFAVGRPDVDRSLPPELQPIVDRYFRSP